MCDHGASATCSKWPAASCSAPCSCWSYPTARASHSTYGYSPWGDRNIRHVRPSVLFLKAHGGIKAVQRAWVNVARGKELGRWPQERLCSPLALLLLPSCCFLSYVFETPAPKADVAVVPPVTTMLMVNC